MVFTPCLSKRGESITCGHVLDCQIMHSFFPMESAQIATCIRSYVADVSTVVRNLLGHLFWQGPLRWGACKRCRDTLCCSHLPPREQLHLLLISPCSPPARVTAGETASSRGRTADHCQFSSVAQSCPTLCNPMDCSAPGFPVLQYLPEFAQT